MTVVSVKDKITAWARENICDDLKLKRAPSDAEAMDAGYAHDLVTPEAFPMFIPAFDRKPPRCAATVPCLCVQPIGGEDAPTQSERNIKVRMCFATWSPGHHGQDDFVPNGDGSYTQSENVAFSPDEDGWRDAWNFMDAALAELEKGASLSGLRIAREKGFKYGAFSENEAVVNLWPFWFTWIEFEVETAISREAEQIRNLL